MQCSYPVNLHPIFLFWKHGSVCDPENMGCKNEGTKNKEYAAWPGLFSFWITMNLFFHPAFCTLYFGPHYQTLKKYHVNPMNYISGCRLSGRLWTLKWIILKSSDHYVGRFCCDCKVGKIYRISLISILSWVTYPLE